MQDTHQEQSLVFAGVEYTQDPETSELRVTPLFELRDTHAGEITGTRSSELTSSTVTPHPATYVART